MLTIGQLARYVGVSTKTIRVYHDKGLLPEPGRDASGYRRYSARDTIALIKIRTLAQAGVPLARIGDLTSATPEEFARTLHQVDLDLTARIRGLRETQRRLRSLDVSHLQLLPPEIAAHLEALPAKGFSRRWAEMETDLWILLCATHPDVASTLFRDQADALADPELTGIFLDYDRVHDLDPADPAIDELAARMAAATRQRYGSGDLPLVSTASDIPALIQGSINAVSPAWQRLDSLLREELGA